MRLNTVFGFITMRGNLDPQNYYGKTKADIIQIGQGFASKYTCVSTMKYEHV